MTVKLTLEFDSYEALVNFLIPNAAAVNKLAMRITPSAPSAATPQTPEPAAAPEEVPVLAAVSPATEPPKRKRGRPSRSDDQAAMALVINPPEKPPTQEVVPAPVITPEQALAEFIKFGGSNVPQALALLARYGVDRFATVPKEHYARFVKDCQDGIAGKDFTASETA